MNKHSYAAAFALIGAGIGGYIAAESKSGNFLPVIYGLCIGCFLGYFFAGLISAKSNILQRSFQKLGDVRGKQLEDIVSAVGDYTSSQPCNITDRNNEQGMFYTWMEDRYSVTLLFGADSKCIGVHKETII